MSNDRVYGRAYLSAAPYWTIAFHLANYLFKYYQRLIGFLCVSILLQLHEC